MKTLSISILFCLYNTLIFSQGTWVRKADFGGTARHSTTAFSIGNKGYMGLGYDGGGTKDFWEYDPGSDTWTQKADYPFTVYSTMNITFVINGKGYISNREYDPGLNIWTTIASLQTFSGGYSFSIGNYGFCGGGNSFNWGNPPYYSNNNSFYKYDPVSDTWTQMANGPEVSYAATFTIGDEGFVITGIHAHFPDDWYTDGVTAYNSVTNTWTYKSVFPGGIRKNANAFSISFPFGSRGYVGLGYDTTGIRFSDFWEYNPNNDSWIQRADFGGGGRVLAAGFSIGNKGYLGTGRDSANNYYNDFWEYTADSTIGINEIDNKIQALINPNPASDHFTVSISPTHSLKTIEIYNSAGVRISIFEKITESLTVNSNKYSKGIYFVKVQTEKGSVVEKLIVQ